VGKGEKSEPRVQLSTAEVSGEGAVVGRKGRGSIGEVPEFGRGTRLKKRDFPRRTSEGG